MQPPMPPNKTPMKEELATEVERLQQVIQNLKTQAQEATAQAILSPPLVTIPDLNHGNPSRVKVTVSNKFNSSIDTADHFLKQLELYFLACRSKFPSGSDWIVFASSYSASQNVSNVW